jgi:Tfp pilus assembly protein PilO
MAGTLNRVRWQAHQLIERGGWPAIAACMLAVGCVVGWLAWAEPLATELAIARRANAQLQQRRQTVRQGVVVAPMSESERLAEFVATFPSDKGIPATFTAMHRMAARHGLQLSQAEFRLAASGNEPLARYAMVLPVRAEYSKLRAFLDELLREVPSIALEELSLRRDDLKTELIDARLRLVMFLSRAG